MTHNANGNTLSDAQGRSFTWDFENRLVQAAVSGQNGGTTTFKYDPFGRRIQKSGPLGTTNYLYDGPNIVDELDDSGNVLARYAATTDVDEPLSEFRGSAASYYQQDGLGSVTTLSNGSGTVANTYTFDSFGKLNVSTGTLTNPYQYTGRESDQETGLYYYRDRYYNQESGRFLGQDRILFRGGINFYNYVYNNPANLTDPNGNAPCLDINSFVNTLDANAPAWYPGIKTGHCGRAMGKALAAGGYTGGKHDGKDYGPDLLDNGFSTVPDTDYTPQTGDVVVFQPYPGDPNNFGHVQSWDGTQWVSDFKQPYPPNKPGGIYPNGGYRDAKSRYDIYRPTPCPPSPIEQSILQELARWCKPRGGY